VSYVWIFLEAMFVSAIIALVIAHFMNRR